jgi:hypothetical protein
MAFEGDPPYQHHPALGDASPTVVTANPPASGVNFYLPTVRVALFLLVAPISYQLWWYWQLCAFTQRERFPRARSFWYLVIPFYNFAVLYRQFDDLKRAAANAEVRTFSSGFALTLVIAGFVASRTADSITSTTGAFVSIVVYLVLVACVGALVQPSANAYLKHAHPGSTPRGVTWGEAGAAALGILVFVLIVLGTFLPDSSGTGSAPPRPQESGAVRSSGTPPVAIPAGWHVVKADLYTVALPPGWKAVGPAFFRDPMVRGVIRHVPASGRYLHAVEHEISSGALSMAAFDFSDRGMTLAVRTGVEAHLIGISQSPDSDTLGQIEHAILRQATARVRNIHVRRTAFRLAGARAGLMTITGDAATGRGRAAPVIDLVFVEIRHATAVALDIVAPGGTAAHTYERTFTSVARSLRIP